MIELLAEVTKRGVLLPNPSVFRQSRCGLNFLEGIR